MEILFHSIAFLESFQSSSTARCINEGFPRNFLIKQEELSIYLTTRTSIDDEIYFNSKEKLHTKAQLKF